MPQQFPAVTLYTQADEASTLMLPSALFEQVLTNLVLNAAQAGATAVWFSALHKDGGVRTQMQDNAGGTERAQLYQAFQSFMTTRKEGMGLRLAICQRLVRRTNGSTEIKDQQVSDGKAGARVTLYSKPNQEGSRSGDNSSAR